MEQVENSPTIKWIAPNRRDPRALLAQLTVGPRRRIRRVQWAHRCRDRRRRIEPADTLVNPVRLVRPRGQRRRLRRARPVIEVEVHEIEVPLQLPEYVENLWLVVA